MTERELRDKIVAGAISILEKNGVSLVHFGEVKHRATHVRAITPNLNGLLLNALIETMSVDDEQFGNKIFIDLGKAAGEDWFAGPGILNLDNRAGDRFKWEECVFLKMKVAGVEYHSIDTIAAYAELKLKGVLTPAEGDGFKFDTGIAFIESIGMQLHEHYLPIYNERLTEMEKETVAAQPKAGDEMDIDALAKVDFDAVGSRVEEMQGGGGEVLDADNDCGDACKI